MHSDYDFGHTKKLSIKHINKLLLESFKRAQKKKAWDMWIVDYSKMDDKNYIAFEDYYDKVTEEKEVEKNKKANIMHDVEKILKIKK